jgi:hypothetical protein
MIANVVVEYSVLSLFAFHCRVFAIVAVTLFSFAEAFAVVVL